MFFNENIQLYEKCLYCSNIPYEFIIKTQITI